jgi:two-component system, NtrC family, sensor histidine kinase KinB
MLMIKSLRTKLLIGIAPLLAIVVGLGLWAIVMFLRLGGNIDVILRENYQSVLAAQNMKEALERMDSSLLFAIGGEEARGREQLVESRLLFDKNFDAERGNITIHPREDQLVAELATLREKYMKLTERFFEAKPADRTRLYFAEALPTFNRIKDRADDVLNLNQRNMEDMDHQARSAATRSIRWMVLALIGSAAVATLIAVVLSRSLLVPIRSVTRAARSMANGDLEQVVAVVSHDELGELAAAFNSMARTIREYNAAGTARLVRAQKTAQATIDAFPDPVVVVDPAGSVERANPAAERLLGAAPVAGATVAWVPPASLKMPLAAVLSGEHDFLPSSFEHAICLRDDGQERFLLPRVLAIRDEVGNLLGAAVVMSDVTRFRKLDQLKSDMVSTVSHELKTPLTSIQMAVHLLLEEVVGPLNSKQLELLIAARQDSDRLLAMINDLLDLTRIEQGRVALDLQPIAPADLVGESVARFATPAQDSGVELAASVGFGLPPVLVDRERIAHVFDNLIGNALAHTNRGGSIHVEAKAEPRVIRFNVRDTGEGIAAEFLPRLFERFFRVPGSRARQGAGLGLAISREIVEAHGGTIDVTSQKGQGSTFTFTLPLATGDQE